MTPLGPTTDIESHGTGVACAAGGLAKHQQAPTWILQTSLTEGVLVAGSDPYDEFVAIPRGLIDHSVLRDLWPTRTIASNTAATQR